MITLTGTVTGVTLLSFEPVNVRPLRYDAPSPRLHTKVVTPDSLGAFSVDLITPTEVAGSWDDGWVWRCTEVAWDRSRFEFIFTVGAEDVRYADLRPLGGGLR